MCMGLLMCGPLSLSPPTTDTFIDINFLLCPFLIHQLYEVVVCMKWLYWLN